MSNRDLLLEIGLEEVPARFIVEAMNQLKTKVVQLLNDEKIDFGHVYNYSTPRRLAILIQDVNEKQNDTSEEVKGPSKKVALDGDGNWTKAAIGFTRGQGKSVDDIYFKEINGVEYVHIEKFTQGQDTINVLSTLAEIIKSLNFPKNMRWANFDLRYVRPIRWLVALFGDQLIDIDITNVKSDRKSYGHRFLGEQVEIVTPREYKQQLLAQHVVVDYNDRKSAIVSQLRNLEEENNWIIPIDPDLLEEVTNLVEYPTVLFGSFDKKYLDLPREVLITTMKEHQRYFPVTDETGKQLLNHFVTVRNGDHKHLEVVARGNEKVLRARLQDAVFFYEEDQKLSIEKALTKLEHVVYHEEIGTYRDKLTRIRTLSQYLLDQLQIAPESQEALHTLRAAEICKFDLVTQMVDEFPELQGLMGEKYASIAGEDQAVSKAINEHYMPRGADGELPKGLVGSIVGIADKLDTLASFFAINQIPTGSQDPYSLRRQASGIAQILLKNGWEIDFQELVEAAVKNTQHFSKQSDEETLNALLGFFNLRFKHMLNEMNIRYDVVDALLSTSVKNVKSLFNKANLLNKEILDPGFKEKAESLSRVINISSKHKGELEIKEHLFESEYERQLYNSYQKLLELQKSNDNEYYRSLVAMKDVINAYFDHTMVMAEQEDIRQNRLSQMKLLADLILSFVHFEKILVK